MPANRFPTLAAAGLILLLQACASAPPVEETVDAAAVEDPNDVPELTLNLPEEGDCACVSEESADYTFLEKGLRALAAGEHVEAVQHFERYQRLESSPLADWESGIAIAYDSMLPNSPFYDPEAASKSFEQLQKQLPEQAQVHTEVRMMHDSLATFVAMERQVTALESNNAILREELEKREEALKRLRELTLGQKGARE